MKSSGSRLRALPVPSGVAALGVLAALQSPLDGSGPAVAPHAANGPPQPLPDSLGDLPPGLSLTIGTSGSTGSPKLAMLTRSEEHTSELQSLRHLVCRLLLEKKT